MRRPLAIVAMTGLFALSGALPALAQSALCLQLVNEMAALDSGGGFGAASPQLEKYERAVRDQRTAITKTRGAAQLNGCGSFGGFFQSSVALCTRIRTSLDQMTANLANLEATRDQLARGGGNVPRRNEIAREMRRNGCQARSNDRFASQPGEGRKRTLLDQIFGTRTLNEDGLRGSSEFDPDDPFASRYRGTFRTLCVRSCDGYYFPISFSTLRDRFAQDDGTCQAMCPGQQVELYFHAMPGQDSEDMISWRTDQPYADLANAFSYRKSVNLDCSCRSVQSGLTEIAGSGGISDVQAEEGGTAAEPALPRPFFRPDRHLDPETMVNVEGGFTREDFDNLIGAKETPASADIRGTSDGERRVRIVGPAFFPVQ